METGRIEAVVGHAAPGRIPLTRPRLVRAVLRPYQPAGKAVDSCVHVGGKRVFHLRSRFERMKRRDFIAFVAGAAAWPLTARAQQPERVRRIGALMSQAADNPDALARIAAF